MSDVDLAVNAFLQAIENRGGQDNRSADVRIFHPNNFMDNLLRPCLKAESALRCLFACEPKNPAVKNPYVGLFSVFDLPVQARLAQPRDWNEPNFIWKYGDEEYNFPQKYLLPVEPYFRRSPGARCMVDDLPAFQSAWDIFTGGALSAMTNWDNIVVAGGSVLASLTYFRSNPSPKALFKIYQSSAYQGSDIDLFIWGLNEEQAKRRMQEIFDAVNHALLWYAVCFRTKNTITIQAEYPKRPIQIVMRLYQSPAEILYGFDVDCCCVAYDGTNVFTIPRGLVAITRQCNTVDISRRSPSYEHRLSKYSYRGYEVFYPDLERGRIDYRQLADPDRSQFPKGLGRLIVYEIMRANFLHFPDLYGESDRSVPTAPVALESLRHSNYDYAWCRVPYGPKWWDTQAVKKHVEKVGDEIIKAISDNHHQGALIDHHVITCGTMTECLERCCDGEAYFSVLPQTREDLANGLFRGPAAFIIEDPGRQTIGSFNPTTNGCWESEAYISLN